LRIIHSFKFGTERKTEKIQSVEVVGIYLPGRGVRLSRPLVEWRVPAGFPSPAQDEIAGRIDLNRDLVKHPLATLYVRVEGDSMEPRIHSGELLEWAFKGLERIFRHGYRYKKAGVMLNRLTPAAQLPIRLFGDDRFERSRRVMKAVDEINARFGRGVVRFGAERPGGRWETKFLRKSPRYTTCLGEVLRVA
jgi:hypothetical protein